MIEITIQHTVEIDKCIAKEIEGLNNKHNILTLYSCCGHDKGRFGFICVHEWDEEEMIKLGYKKNGVFQTKANGFENRYTSFRCKSVCNGRC